MEDCIDKICSDKYAGIYKGILLGEKSDIDESTQELYRLSGISHILSISGLHISLIGYFVYRRMRKISGYVISGIAASFLVVSYGVMIGGSITTRRAIIMFIIHIIGDIVGRKYDILTSLCVALIIMTIDNPLCLKSSGVLMSFGAILGIVILYNNIKEILMIKNTIICTFLTSECINITTLPIIATSYYEISTYSCFINLLVIPLMSIVVASGFTGVLAGSINIKLGKILIKSGCFVLKLYECVCEFAMKMPYNTKITGIPDKKKIIIYYIMVLIIILVAKICIYLKNNDDAVLMNKTFKNNDDAVLMNKILKNISIIFATVIISVFLCNVLTYHKKNVLKIQMLDVGQGDCICINNGKWVILTDGGSSSSKKIAEYTIIPFLKANGFEQVDYLMISHSDDDHINGILTLMEYKYNGRNYVKNIVLPKINENVIDERYLELEKKARQKGINVVYFGEGSVMELDDVNIKCISPNSNKIEDKNELSMVYYLNSKNITMLFTGDMGTKGEISLMEKNLIQKVDILKVGHHGSNGGSIENFINHLNPKVSLISCGINNSYGHPAKETILRLKEIGSDIYITSECGQIDIIESKNGFKVHTFIQCFKK
jgi:competence protein ComEC